MPALKNAKHERFAQLIAKGTGQAEAYAECGYRPSDANASTLRSNQKVAARIAEIVDRAAIRCEITLESHLADLQSLRDQALAARQFGAAITAEIARGKASGVHVEKSESLVTTRELPASVDEFV